MMNKLLIAFSILAISQTASALHIEPGIVYETGEHKYDWPAPFSDSTGETKGSGVNLKLGGSFNDVVFLVLDGTYTKPKFTNSANNYDANATSSLLGVTLGAQMPILGLRVWGGYIFDGALDPEESGGVDVKFEGANGYKVGAGLRILLVSLNIEYADLEYKDTTLEAGSFTTTSQDRFANKLTMVSLSFPLSF